MFSVSKLFITFNKEKAVQRLAALMMMKEKCCQCQKSHASFFVICQNIAGSSSIVLDLLLSSLVTRSRGRIEDGGHQEEDAGHEGREGQPDGQMRCLWAGGWCTFPIIHNHLSLTVFSFSHAAMLKWGEKRRRRKSTSSATNPKL